MGENLTYALVQVIHNFGAVAVVGAPLMALWPAPAGREAGRSLAWLVCAGWAMQAASGAGFGAVSYYHYGSFPDIHGVAVAALAVKAVCAAAGFALSVLYLYRGAHFSDRSRERMWHRLAALGVVALTAAAFLRWFS